VRAPVEAPCPLLLQATAANLRCPAHLSPQGIPPGGAGSPWMTGRPERTSPMPLHRRHALGCPSPACQDVAMTSQPR